MPKDPKDPLDAFLLLIARLIADRHIRKQNAAVGSQAAKPQQPKKQ